MPRLRITGITWWVAPVGAFAVLTSVLMGAAFGRAATEGRAGTIAFLRLPPGASSGQDVGGPSLFVMKADDTGLRRLTSPDSHVYSYAWSPDGSLIAYTDGDSLWLIRPDGTGRMQLFSRSGFRLYTATWSPDGKAIAVELDDPNVATGDVQTYVVPTDGGAPHRLGTGWVQSPSWSPRGDEITYGSKYGEIWIVRSDGSHARRVARPPQKMGLGAGFGGPLWSPDGRRLAFNEGDSKDGRYASIYVVNPDGSNLRRLTKHAYNEYGFRWSPDSRKILYGRENRKGIYVIGADGRNDRKITTDSPRPAGWGALAWFPDGRAIAYATNRTGNGDIYLIGADGHHKVRFTTSSAIDIDPSWTAR